MARGFKAINVVINDYPIIKGDLIFNFIVLGAWLYIKDLKILSFISLFSILLISYLIFNNRGYRISLVLILLSGGVFILKTAIPLAADLKIFVSFVIWSLLIYGLYWIPLGYINQKKYLESLKPVKCPVCKQERPKKDFVFYQNQKMCEDCYSKFALKISDYHGTRMYQWDSDFLNTIEHDLGEPIPEMMYEEKYERGRVEYGRKFGFVLEEGNIVHLSIPHKNLKDIPRNIHLLVHLRVLNLRWNHLADMPVSIRELWKLRHLDLRDNPIDFTGPDLTISLHKLYKRNCNVLVPPMPSELANLH